MEQDYDSWESAARLLTVSPSYLSKKVASVMIDQNVKGRLVLSASDAVREPEPNLALSDVCRISILGLVRTLARELGPRGIRVNLTKNLVEFLRTRKRKSFLPLATEQARSLAPIFC